MDAEVATWQAVREGSVAELQLAQAFRLVAPKLCKTPLSERLCSVFYVVQEQWDGRDEDLATEEAPTLKAGNALPKFIQKRAVCTELWLPNALKRAERPPDATGDAIATAAPTSVDGSGGLEPSGVAEEEDASDTEAAKRCEMCRVKHTGVYGSGRFEPGFFVSWRHFQSVLYGIFVY